MFLPFRMRTSGSTDMLYTAGVRLANFTVLRRGGQNYKYFVPRFLWTLPAKFYYKKLIYRWQNAWRI